MTDDYSQKEIRITEAYKSSKNIYDDVLTQNNLLTKLYIKLFWGVNDFKIAENVLNYISSGFSGRLLDVPVGTGVFTYKKYGKLTDAEIVCVDYSEEMLNQARKRSETISSRPIQCRKGDVGNRAFENDSFDVVLSMNRFHAFPEKQKAFSATR